MLDLFLDMNTVSFIALTTIFKSLVLLMLLGTSERRLYGDTDVSFLVPYLLSIQVRRDDFFS